MTARRDFLAVTAGAVAARTVPPLAARAAVVNPDARLIAACKALPARLAASNASDSSSGDTPEDLAYFEVEDIIMTTPAMTMEGLLAKAEATRVYGVENYSGDDPCPHGEYARIAAWRSWHVVHDLLRIVGAS